MKLKKVKIFAVAHDPVDTRRIFLDDYRNTRQEYKRKYRLQLPTLEEIRKRSDSKDLRVLLNHINIRISTSEGVLSYVLKRGFITDFASVPRYLRSFVDNDNLSLLVPALVHDANFACHFFDFKTSNKLLRSMARYAGASWWMGFKLYWAVSTSFGKEAYRKSPEQLNENRQWALLSRTHV